MNKKEADTILLACKKHGITLTMRNEAGVYKVTFSNRIEITSFEGAKLITNGLVIEGKFNNDRKKHITGMDPNAKLNFSKYPKRKKRSDSGVNFAERRGCRED